MHHRVGPELPLSPATLLGSRSLGQESKVCPQSMLSSRWSVSIKQLHKVDSHMPGHLSLPVRQTDPTFKTKVKA